MHGKNRQTVHIAPNTHVFLRKNSKKAEVASRSESDKCSESSLPLGFHMGFASGMRTHRFIFYQREKAPETPELSGNFGVIWLFHLISRFRCYMGPFHFAPFLGFHFAPKNLCTPGLSNSRIFTRRGAPVFCREVRRDLTPPWRPEHEKSTIICFHIQ